MTRWMQWARLKIRSVLGRARVEDELSMEIEHHLDLETEKNIALGMHPAEARRMALLSFGGVDRFSEATRAARGTGSLDRLLQDLAYAVRGMRRNPGFAALVVGTLALGVGGATAIFSVVDGVLLRPLPFPEPDRLVRIWSSSSDARFLELTHQDFDALRSQTRTFDHLGAFSEGIRSLTDESSTPAKVHVARVSGEFFATLGAPLALGRDFTEAEKAVGAPLAILSHELWRQRYGSDPGVLGRHISLDGDPLTVVGVVSAGMSLPRRAQVWRPLTVEAREDDDREFLVVGRLAADVDPGAARAEAAGLAARRQRTAPDTNAGIDLWLEPLQAMLVRDVRTPLLVLLAAVGLVLAIACANIANLLLARASSRQSEMAIRSALGAGRPRLVRQLLTESAVLAVAGGILGVLLGGGLLRGVLRLLPPETPRLDAVGLDVRVLAVTAVVTVLCGVAFGVVPAFLGSRSGIRGALAAGAPGRLGGRRHSLQAGLVVVQVALATVVVTSAGLLATSLIRLSTFERGFDAERLLVVPIEPVRDFEPGAALAHFDGVRSRLADVPGVEALGLGLRSPLYGRGINLRIFEIEGLPEPAPGAPAAGVQMVEPAYFSTLGVAVVRGRGLDDGDRPDGEHVAVVNESFARAYFGSHGLDPVGHVVTRPSWTDGTTLSVRIVGVVEDVVAEPRQATQPQLFFPFHQNPTHGMTALIRHSGAAGAVLAGVRDALWDLDPTLALDDAGPASAQIAATQASDRFNLWVLGLFAGVALALSAVGIYGLMAYRIAERSREMGLRRALGAPSGRIVATVLGQGLLLGGLGASLGLIGTLVSGRVLDALLFGIRSTHPATLAGVTALFLAVVAAACARPALRATRADPISALRSE